MSSGIVPRVPEETSAVGRPGRRRRPTAPHDAQLPSGRHGLSPRFVAANQRDRIVEAFVNVVFSLGFPAASVERVAARAGVSRRTFYEQFDGKEDLFVRTCDEAAARLYARVDAARASGGSASEQLHAGLAALLDGLASEPRVAHMCVVGVLSAGPAAIERRDAHNAGFARLLEEIARDQEGGAPLPPLTAEGIVGAVHDVVYKRIAAGEASTLPALLDDLHGFCAMLFGQATDPRPA